MHDIPPSANRLSQLPGVQRSRCEESDGVPEDEFEVASPRTRRAKAGKSSDRHVSGYATVTTDTAVLPIDLLNSDKQHDGCKLAPNVLKIIDSPAELQYGRIVPTVISKTPSRPAMVFGLTRQ